jgi:hypothetical protein
MKRTFRNAIALPLLAAMTLALLPALSSEALAHRTGRPHRHPHGPRVRAAIVIGTPIVLATAVILKGRPHGAIDFNVRPKDTRVWVDGRLRGEVGRFDGNPDVMYLLPGVHEITLRTPDGVSVTRKVKVVAGHEISLKMRLEDLDD